MGTTSRLILPYPAAGAANNVPADIQALADDLDSKLARSGVAASAPASPKDGQRYYATDTHTEMLGNAGAWISLNPWNSYGLRTDRPAANTVRAGSLYISTDTIAIFMSDGVSTWTRINTPAGTVSEWACAAGSAAPAGHVLADGSLYSTTSPIYADLYAACGTQFGAGTGTFRVPDRRTELSAGADSMGGGASRYGSGSIYYIGTNGNSSVRRTADFSSVDGALIIRAYTYIVKL